MLSEVQEIQVQQILDEASNKVSEVFGKEVRVFCNRGIQNNIQRLSEAICEYFTISWDQLIANNREHERVIARQLFCWFAIKYFNYKKVQIASLLDRHHTSVIHAIKTVDDMIYTKDEEYVKDIQVIRECLSIK
jgi:chromosomal replication initiation ATPase DnaA